LNLSKEAYVRGLDGNPHYKQCLIQSIGSTHVTVFTNYINRPRTVAVLPSQISIPGLNKIPQTCQEISDYLNAKGQEE